jgi:hypothetical protein
VAAMTKWLRETRYDREHGKARSLGGAMSQRDRHAQFGSTATRLVC